MNTSLALYSPIYQDIDKSNSVYANIMGRAIICGIGDVETRDLNDDAAVVEKTGKIIRAYYCEDTQM